MHVHIPNCRMFRLGWSGEEEEKKEGQEESRGRNEGGREGEIFIMNIETVAAPVEGCRKTTPCKHTLKTSIYSGEIRYIHCVLAT